LLGLADVLGGVEARCLRCRDEAGSAILAAFDLHLLGWCSLRFGWRGTSFPALVELPPCIRLRAGKATNARDELFSGHLHNESQWMRINEECKWWCIADVVLASTSQTSVKQIPNHPNNMAVIYRAICQVKDEETLLTIWVS
jgi:hypothetical protein